MDESPVLVFVPGAWHKPSCYDKIIDILKLKFTCIAVTLQSTSGDPKATFEDDIRAARTIIDKEVNQGNNVVVIAHSYGGMVGNSSIKGYAKSGTNRDATDRDRGHVIGIVLIASGFTITGLAFMDPFFGIPPPQWKKNESTGFAELVGSPRYHFYHDLPVDDGNYWVGELTPQSLKSLFEGGEFAYGGWQDVPAWYIGTLEDKAFPLFAQRLNVGMAEAQGGDITHRELPTSHSPFLSQPRETTGIISEAIEDFLRKEASHDATSKRKAISPPIPIWPVRWWRYGFWKSFGRVVGGVMVLTRWFKSLFRSR